MFRFCSFRDNGLYMLTGLSIRDYLLIARLDLEPGGGFTALTGETGAGKSILLSALGFALGERAPKSCIRKGAVTASVTASFEVGERHPVRALLAARGVDAPPGEPILFRRAVRTSGPARAFINDQAVSAGLLSEAGALLVEIHGQHEGQGLLNVGRHRMLLDGAADSAAELTQTSAAWQTWTTARAEREAIEARLNKAAAERTYLEHVLDELDELAPEAGEAEKLALDRAALQASERVADAIGDAESALTRANVEGAIATAVRVLGRAQSLPGMKAENAESDLSLKVGAAMTALDRALIEAGEARAALEVAARGCEYSPAALEASEARLFALRAAARKHGVEADQLAGLREAFRVQLDDIETADERLATAQANEQAAKDRYVSAADRLTQKRKAGARKLEQAVAKEFGPLKLGKTNFRVAISEQELTDAGPSGLNEIAFEIATNGAAEFGPLTRIASGGEMARLSLAISVCLARASSCETLVFDEADVGVGGAVAAAVGERLAKLGEDRQVLAITHSPQVAAAASQQIRVAKSEAKGRVRTSVDVLEPKARKEEIARMLAGAEVTREARAAAGRLLAGA